MREIASGSGTVIFEDGRNLRVVKRGGPLMPIVIGVLTLLVGVMSMNTIVQIFLFAFDKGPVISLRVVMTLVGVTVFSCVVLWAVLRKRRAIRSIPPDQLPVICTLDFSQRVLLDDMGTKISSLDEVSYAKTFQVTSSTPALVLQVGGVEAVMLARGNVFAGGISSLEYALKERGIREGR